jgi:hypothetical protein
MILRAKGVLSGQLHRSRPARIVNERRWSIAGAALIEDAEEAMRKNVGQTEAVYHVLSCTH